MIILGRRSSTNRWESASPSNGVSSFDVGKKLKKKMKVKKVMKVLILKDAKKQKKSPKRGVKISRGLKTR